MKIGLIDMDKNNFPNYALMKIYHYYKKNNNLVESINYFEKYDKVYISKVFSFTEDEKFIIQSEEIEKGGTGYNFKEIFCDDIEPDYTLYPNLIHSYGFLTRGCLRNCNWCIVPKKEGNLKPYRDIETILQNRKSAILMDNNVLASNFGLEQIEKIIKLKCLIDFNQGLDSRLVTDDIAKMLSKVKWIRHIRFSCDTSSQLEPLILAIEKLNKYGIKNSKLFVYCLLDNFQDSYDRIKKIKEIGANPFAQPYINFNEKNRKNVLQWQKDMARWCNRKEILKTVDFKEYKPRKNFKCKEYFNEKN